MFFHFFWIFYMFFADFLLCFIIFLWFFCTRAKKITRKNPEIKTGKKSRRPCKALSCRDRRTDRQTERTGKKLGKTQKNIRKHQDLTLFTRFSWIFCSFFLFFAVFQCFLNVFLYQGRRKSQEKHKRTQKTSRFGVISTVFRTKI